MSIVDGSVDGTALDDDSHSSDVGSDEVESDSDADSTDRSSVATSSVATSSVSSGGAALNAALGSLRRLGGTSTNLLSATPSRPMLPPSPAAWVGAEPTGGAGAAGVPAELPASPPPSPPHASSPGAAPAAATTTTTTTTTATPARAMRLGEARGGIKQRERRVVARLEEKSEGRRRAAFAAFGAAAADPFPASPPAAAAASATAAPRRPMRLSDAKHGIKRREARVMHKLEERSLERSPRSPPRSPDDDRANIEGALVPSASFESLYSLGEADQADAEEEEAEEEADGADALSVSLSLWMVCQFVLCDLIGHWQVTSSLVAAMPHLDWPAFFVRLSDGVSAVFNLGFLTRPGALDCELRTSYCSRALVAMLALLAFQIALPAFVLVLRAVAASSRQTTSSPPPSPPPPPSLSRARLDALVDRGAHGHLLLLLLAHAPLSAMLLRLLQCRDLGGGLRVLDADVRLGCRTDATCVGTAVVFLALYSVAVPAYAALVMRGYLAPAAPARDASHPRHAMVARHERRLGFLAGRYGADFWWWELIELTRRLLLQGVTSLVRTGTYSQLLAKMGVSLFFLLLLLRARPFRAHGLETLALSIQACTLGTLLHATLAQACFFGGGLDGHSGEVSQQGGDALLLLLQLVPVLVALCIVASAAAERTTTTTMPPAEAPQLAPIKSPLAAPAGRAWWRGGRRGSSKPKGREGELLV